MKLNKTKLLTSAALLITVSLGQAAVTANFDGLTAGAVTQTDLTNATTGGTFFLFGRGATYNAVSDGSGDIAVVADDTAGNAGDINLIALTATAGNEIDLTVTDALLTFRVTTPRTGNNKGIRFRFRAQDNDAIGTLDWNHDAPRLVLNAGAADEDSVNQTGTERFDSSGSGQTVWDPTSTKVHDVSILFSGTTITATFGSQTLTSSFTDLTSTDVGRLQVFTTGTAGGAKGVWLDDVSLTAVPEPSSTALLGLGGLALIMRRRKA